MSDGRGEPLFEVGPFKGYPADDGSFYYVEVGGNGEDMNVSETYLTVEHAREGAEARRRRSTGRPRRADERLQADERPVPKVKPQQRVVAGPCLTELRLLNGKTNRVAFRVTAYTEIVVRCVDLKEPVDG